MITRTFPTTDHIARTLVSHKLHGLRWTLRSFSYLNHTDIVVVREAISICEKSRGTKTKAAVLRRKLKKMEKQFQAAIQLLDEQKSEKAVRA